MSDNGKGSHGARPGAARPELSWTIVHAAAAYPEATEDFPWGERVAKVRKKIFAFLGADGSDDPSLSLKLPESADHALSFSCAAPTGYGLGRAGWVTIRLGQNDCPELELLLDWLEESYRTVAPVRLVKQLDMESSAHKDPITVTKPATTKPSAKRPKA